MRINPYLATPHTPVNATTGRQLAYQLRGLTVDRRAKVARLYVDGTVALGSLTKRQAASLFRVSARRLGSDAPKRPPTEEQIEKFILDVGVDRVWNVVDRITTPQSAAAE